MSRAPRLPALNGAASLVAEILAPPARRSRAAPAAMRGGRSFGLALERPALLPPEASDPVARAGAEIGAVARRILNRRAARLAHFGAELSQDAVWNMLLELLVARIERRPVSIKCLWVASGLPATTALRWVRQLEQGGHIIRRDDPGDGRRQLMAIEDGLALRIMAFLKATEGEGE